MAPYRPSARASRWLAFTTALVSAAVALPLAYFATLRQSRTARVLDAVAAVPYAVPGTVLAIAIILVFLPPVPLLDRGMVSVYSRTPGHTFSDEDAHQLYQSPEKVEAALHERASLWVSSISGDQPHAFRAQAADAFARTLATWTCGMSPASSTPPPLATSSRSGTPQLRRPTARPPSKSRR